MSGVSFINVYFEYISQAKSTKKFPKKRKYLKMYMSYVLAVDALVVMPKNDILHCISKTTTAAASQYLLEWLMCSGGFRVLQLAASQTKYSSQVNINLI